MPINLYFDTPFATSGDTTTVPDGTQSDGSVSYTQGYPVAYSTAVASGGFNFPRAQHNQVLKDVTAALQLMQQNGVFSFITTAMNGGINPYSYNLGALVLYDISDGNGPQVWKSTAKTNTTIPGAGGAKWVAVGKPTLYTGGTSGGTANAQTVTTGNGGFANTQGNIVTWIAGASVTSSSTLNPDASSNIPLKVMTATGLRNTQTGDVVINGEYMAISDGTNLQILNPTALSQRVQLTANATYYIATTGNDSTGNGTVGTPWLTLSKALAYICSNIDLGGFTATVQVADGTYSAAQTFAGYFTGALSNGGIIINGNAVTPANVKFTSGIFIGQMANVSFQNMEFANAGASGIQAGEGGQVHCLAGCVFGTSGNSHLLASDGGRIFLDASYTIVGGAAAHANAISGGQIKTTGTPTVTLTGTPNFSSGFVTAAVGSVVDMVGVTFSGPATGSRYVISANAVAYTNGAGATYFPGNSAGSTATGGQYV